MNSSPDRGADDPLRDSREEERNVGPAERPDSTLWLFDADRPPPRIRDLAEENIGPSAASPLGEEATVEWVPVRGLADPYILAPDILDLKIVREAPRQARGPSGPFGCFSLAISIPIVIAIVTLLIVRTLPTGGADGTGGHGPWADSSDPGLIGQTQAAVEPRTQGTTEESNSPRARLVVLRAPPRSADEVIPLGLSLAEGSGDAALVLAGPPVGWTISTGFPLGADNWVLSASELGDAAIRPPRGFVGTIDLAVELRLADDTVADRLSLRMTWVEAPKTSTAIAAAQTSAVAAPAETGSTGTPLRRLDRDEVANLRKRGEEFMLAGNLGLARLTLQRAAEAGDPQAAFALATTYDPILLETRRVIGVVPDIAKARAWYEKAKEFGSTAASLRLEILEERNGRRSTIITSQIPVDKGRNLVGDPTYADASLDRIVHKAHRINLSRHSLRRSRASRAPNE
jgi:IstB-like ATP binding protein